VGFVVWVVAIYLEAGFKMLLGYEFFLEVKAPFLGDMRSVGNLTRFVFLIDLLLMVVLSLSIVLFEMGFLIIDGYLVNDLFLWYFFLVIYNID
jgi:hypothetical protein